MNKLLEREHDLRYRPAVGDQSYYQLDIYYNDRDELGFTKESEHYRGKFQRTVEAVEGNGRVSETISWRDIEYRLAPDGTTFGDWNRPEWARDISYPFAAEDRYDEFHWKYDQLPHTDTEWPIAWKVLLLTVDAHFEFDFLRTVKHGGIDQLRRVGDSVLTPDSNGTFWLGFPPYIDVPAFTKPDLRTSFVGLTALNGHECARLEFTMGPGRFEMSVMNFSRVMSSRFRGSLTIRLSDGSLEAGEFDEFVYSADGCATPRYEITRLEALA